MAATAVGSGAAWRGDVEEDDALLASLDLEGLVAGAAPPPGVAKEAVEAVGEPEKKKRPRVPPLDESLLMSARGLPRLRETFPKRMKFQGPGHEAADLTRLLGLYRGWARELYPSRHEEDVLENVGKLRLRPGVAKARAAAYQETKAAFIKDRYDVDIAPLAAVPEDEPEDADGGGYPGEYGFDDGGGGGGDADEGVEWPQSAGPGATQSQVGATGDSADGSASTAAPAAAPSTAPAASAADDELETMMAEAAAAEQAAMEEAMADAEMDILREMEMDQSHKSEQHAPSRTRPVPQAEPAEAQADASTPSETSAAVFRSEPLSEVEEAAPGPSGEEKAEEPLITENDPPVDAVQTQTEEAPPRDEAAAARPGHQLEAPSEPADADVSESVEEATLSETLQETSTESPARRKPMDAPGSPGSPAAAAFVIVQEPAKTPTGSAMSKSVTEETSPLVGAEALLLLQKTASPSVGNAGGTGEPAENVSRTQPEA